jgi:hypothetical protein
MPYNCYVSTIVPKEALFRKLDGLRPLVLPVIVVLVAVAAFGLGRLSAEQGHPALRILYPNAQAASPAVSSAAVANTAKAAQLPANAASDSGGDAVVASKTGTKYYLPSCSGASRIKDENKIYFATAAQAQAAGYGPAANCPGL